jgi:hypothetical protein
MALGATAGYTAVGPMKKNLLRVLLLFSIACSWMVFDFCRTRFITRRNYNHLRIGMNVNDIPWPDATMSFIACEKSAAATTHFIRKEEWPEFVGGRKTFPPECEKMTFFITGYFPLHGIYSIEFDPKWDISKVGPLVFHAS